MADLSLKIPRKDIEFSTGSSYLYTTGFESTGIESGWTEFKAGSGTLNWDQTSGALVGSQSLECYGGGGSDYGGARYSLAQSYDTVHVFFRMKFTTLMDHTTDTPIFQIRNASEAPVGKLVISSTEKWRVVHGTAESYAATGPVQGTEYYVWLTVSEGSGSNGVTRAYIGTTGAKSSATMIEETAGNDADQNPQIIEPIAMFSDVILFDSIIVSDSEIGDQ